jgi:hypothetical protein
MSGGGGSSGTQRVEQTNVPDWARPQFQEMLGRGIALSQTEYQPYTGTRQAGFNPMQEQAFGQAQTQQVAPQLGAATGLTGLAALQGLNAQFNPFQTGQFTGQTAQQYMNPFMQNVVDIQKREAQRAADIAGTQRGAQAVRAGAFGGSRQAIMDAEAQRNLAQQMGDIQATGSQAAFQSAQDQFNREQQMREQSRQFGAGFGMEGLRTALSGAGQLGQLGQQQFGQQMDITGLQRDIGREQQLQEQRRLDQQFADFQAQRDFPYQQIGFLSDLLRGAGSSTRSIYQPPSPSALQTVAGLGTAAAGFGGFGRAEGGSIPSSYADGGITSLLGDQQLAQTTQNREQSPMMQLAAAEEAQQRAMLRSAAPAEMPEMSDMTEEELLAALQSAIQQGDETKARVIAELIEERKMPESGIAMIAPESVGEVPEGGIMGMYDGGAVAFQEGGRTPYTPRLTSGQRMLDDAIQSGLIAFEDMPDALPIQLAREGTRQTVDALGNVVEAVADTKALPMSAGYLNQRERDEAAREARRAAKSEREAGVKSPSTAAPMVAAVPTGNVATPAGGGRGIMAGPTAEDLAQATRENPRLMAGLPALAKTPGADAPAGNVATPGGAGSGVMGESQLMAMARRFGIDPQAAADRQTALA